jgi:predicted AAA+ superfamily ATPase
MKKIIQRGQYLERLLLEKDNELVKVVSGIRRSGKTYILKMYQDYLVSVGISEKSIVYMNFESFANQQYLKAETLYEYVISRQETEGQRLYLFFDEIQLVEDWQRAINSFRVDLNADIYITGSNASLLSGEMATLLSGRYTEIKVYPLSFREFLNFHKIDPEDRPKVFKAYDQYFKFGGMPTLSGLSGEDSKLDYLSSTYDSILLNDVSARENGAKNVDALQKLSLFLMDAIGSEISINKLENRLKSNKVHMSRPTISNYLRLMEEAYVYYRLPRQDIRGAKQLAVNGKYYIADTGLWHSQMRNFNTNMGRKLENIVFIELLRRGYQLQSGVYDGREIDFIATKINQKSYIQVTYDLPENSDREIDNFLKLPDNYEKLLIVNHQPENMDVKGLKIINIVDWLLSE